MKDLEVKTKENEFFELKRVISKEKKIVSEMNSLLKDLERAEDLEERKMILSHIISLKKTLKNSNDYLRKYLDKTNLSKPLPKFKDKIINKEKHKSSLNTFEKIKKYFAKNKSFSEFEKSTLKRIKKKKSKKKEEKEIKPSNYVKISNNLFSEISRNLLKNELFKSLQNDLIKANLRVLPVSYISIILFTTLVSSLASVFIFIFLLFFNIGSIWPIITPIQESIGTRFLKTFWILFAIPIGTILFTYFYPSMERKSIERKINLELPFATIHMSAVAGSMINPSKIFTIIISTGDYPYLQKEFIKLMNEINVLGKDIVSALKSSSNTTASKKLSELFNGLATTINSGGNLSEFFEKRSQTILFDYKIENEKRTRAAETFMDIYISVVIAAPMILMLLLIMMKISGLGISLSTSMITIVMVLGVTVINVIFLTFLHLKQPS